MCPKNGLPPLHPGEYLKEILEELEMSQAEFARKVGLSIMRISLIIRGKRPVTAEMALVFGKAFGQTPQYWLNLQAPMISRWRNAPLAASLPTFKRSPVRNRKA